jgi:hypothetical protein
MPVRPLPSKANLDHLKHQAKDLMKAHAARSLAAAQPLREFHPHYKVATDAEIFSARLSLSAAQLTVAREHGFPSWMRLKKHIEAPSLADRLDLPHHERIEDAAFRRAVDLIDAGDAAGLAEHLRMYPRLARARVVFEGGNYFRNPSLLEFIAENPIRHGRLPENILAVAEVLLDAGAEHAALVETLGLVATGRVARECGVQIPLIDLLCDHGADPHGALEAAIGQGELEAVNALIRRGARISLPVVSAMGRVEEARRLLPGAGNEDRHRALAVAAQFGRVEVVRMLLEVGEDPNRYNSAGFHSHSTPLHQAALAGHEEVVRLLVERGARVDMKDVLWKGTPADWAHHEGKTEIEAYLRTWEEKAREEKAAKKP